MTFDTLLPPIAAIVIGYLFGSIPFGILLTRSAGEPDLRSIGSGNIGATNVLRTGRKELAALTLLLDALKGAAAIVLVRAMFARMEIELDPLTALGALMGHLYPVWLRFRGGKGVATLLGIVAALAWQVGLAAAVVWVLTLALFRYSSLAGIAMALSTPVAAALFDRFDLALLFLAFALIVVFKHGENLERLMGGTEPKVGSPRSADA